jgi:AraC-like DNA-binding protein
MQLRGRRALERLAEGEGDLAGLAAELGFADQAHLTRTLREQTGRTPQCLRELLTTSVPDGEAPGMTDRPQEWP